METKDTFKKIKNIDWEKKKKVCKDEISKDFEDQVIMLPQGDNLLVYFRLSFCTVVISCEEYGFGELIVENFNSMGNIVFPSDLQLLLDLLTHISKTMNVKLVLGEKTNG